MVEASEQSRSTLKAYLQGLESETQAKAAASEGLDHQVYEQQQRDLKVLLASTASQLDKLNQRNSTVGKLLLAVAILVATSAYIVVEYAGRSAFVAAPLRTPVPTLAPVAATQSQSTERIAPAASSSKPAVTEPSNASRFVGQTRTVCGKLAEITPAVKERPWYLNFDHAFPRQTFQAIVWPNDLAKVEGAVGAPLGTLRNSAVCITGEISSYKGTAQMRVGAADQLVRTR